MFTMFARTKVAKLAVFAVASLTALGIGTGVTAPQSALPAAHAQGLVEYNWKSVSPNNPNAGGYYRFTNPGGNYRFGDIVRADYGLVVPVCVNGIYESTRSTRGGGYRITLQSKTAFVTGADGNYLFVLSPDGNYLFTGLSNGTLMTAARRPDWPARRQRSGP